MSEKSRQVAGQSNWQTQPAAWALILGLVERACQTNRYIRSLQRRLLEQTGTRLVDWLDHVCIAEADLADRVLANTGFVFCDQHASWHHPRAQLPRIVRPRAAAEWPVDGLAIKVESVDRFLEVNGVKADGDVLGHVASDLRMAVVSAHVSHSLAVVERHGNQGLKSSEPTDPEFEAVTSGMQQFVTRPRPRVEAASGFAAARERFDTVAARLGQSRGCDLFFAAERAYWQQRNFAARVQCDTQDRLGLGWANHDHHTYRCSREHFATLIGFLEHMGFECRERFHAGAQAGWGAQILEHPTCQIVVFADVDLSPEEVTGDFAHDGLPPRHELGTVGLWCKLHGEAILHAGMHHLECQFEFDAARKQLSEQGVETMEPFTNFAFLRQAFTVGEQWPVDSSHLDHLLRGEWITSEQVDQFSSQGARGSHLEILERNDGYKGFNQSGISEIITRTDPRKSQA